MLRTVLKRFGPGRYRPARIPGMPWFRCFTNRWWRPLPRAPHYLVTEATTGFTPLNANEDSREAAIRYATYRLRRLPRAKVLAAITRIQAGHYDRQRIPKRFTYRSL